jgi:PAS domain S-box-containing protein
MLGPEQDIENLCHLFIAKSPLLVCFTDYFGNIFEVSPSVVISTGFSRDELASISTIDGSTEDKGADNSIMGQIRMCEHGKSIDEKQVLIKRKDGTKFPGLLTCISLGEIKGKSVFGISISKASNLVNSKDDVKNMFDDLKKKDSLKDEFIAVASHELRTPIQPILGLALLAMRGKISNEEAWKDVLKEARRLQQLANDILDVSRIEAGNLAYRMDPANLSEILESVIKTISLSEQGQKINFHVNIDKDMRSTTGLLDRSRLTQVFTNIIGNAVKFTGSGDVTIDARINRERQMFQISISDNGGGIPDSILPRLFNKFVTRGVGSSEQHGSGLGLYISKGIINAHRGTIFACNNERGATFMIYLPLIEPR